jgi:uncharacterized protein (TIGR03435 family)
LRAAFGLILMVGSVVSGFGQVARVPSSVAPLGATATSSDKLPIFDVVSVKENREGTGNISFNSAPAGISITGAPMVNLVMEAYGLYNANEDQVEGLTGWAKAKRFDITGKVAEPDVPKLQTLTREQSGDMLLTVLVDRFHLAAHREVRQMPVYALVLTKHGSKLVATNPDVFGPAGSHVSGCKAGCMSSNERHLDGKGVGSEEIAQFLTRKLHRKVIDQTGLTGKYDLSLDWKPEQEQGADASNAADLLTAIQEQWGLKVEAAKGPVEYVVVDHVEEPSAN